VALPHSTIVAHQGFTRLPDNPDVRPSESSHQHLTELLSKLESCSLPLNSKPYQSDSTSMASFRSSYSASDKVDFVDGLKKIAGNGDPTLREGLAIHMYLANTSMEKKAF
jgi:homogentisate 1,2-dioxygenase